MSPGRGTNPGTLAAGLGHEGLGPDTDPNPGVTPNAPFPPKDGPSVRCNSTCCKTD